MNYNRAPWYTIAWRALWMVPLCISFTIFIILYGLTYGYRMTNNLVKSL